MQAGLATECCPTDSHPAKLTAQADEGVACLVCETFSPCWQDCSGCGVQDSSVPEGRWSDHAEWRSSGHAAEEGWVATLRLKNCRISGGHKEVLHGGLSVHSCGHKEVQIWQLVSTSETSFPGLKSCSNKPKLPIQLFVWMMWVTLTWPTFWHDSPVCSLTDVEKTPSLRNSTITGPTMPFLSCKERQLMKHGWWLANARCCWSASCL